MKDTPLVSMALTAVSETLLEYVLPRAEIGRAPGPAKPYLARPSVKNWLRTWLPQYVK